MKITITKVEALQILTRHFDDIIGTFTTVEISDIAMEWVKPLFESVEQYRYTSDQKIIAIKALIRACVDLKLEYTLGLADAKWAIEHWYDFRNFVTTFQRLPKSGFAYETMK
jgi:hypothetical protein